MAENNSIDLDALFEGLENENLSDNSELDSLFKDVENNRYISEEESLLKHVFQENPQIVDYYFSQKSKDASFQLTLKKIKEFGVKPKPLLEAIAAPFKGVDKEDVITDYDRFLAVTGSRNPLTSKLFDGKEIAYPYGDSDIQAGITADYNITKRTQKLSDQVYKPTFSEALTIGAAEGINRATKGVSELVAEQYDLENNTDYLSYIEKNWDTIDLEGSGVADFARFTTQYGLPFGTALKIGNTLRGFQKLSNLKYTGVLGKTANFAGKIGYYGVPGFATAYVLTQGEEDIPWYVTDDLGKMMGLEEQTTLEDEANLFGSEKAAVAVRNRFRLAISEGLMTGGIGATIPSILKGAYYTLFGSATVGGAKIPYGVFPLAISGLKSNVDMLAMSLGKSYSTASWGIKKTGEIFSKITPDAAKKQASWFKDAVANRFPSYSNWKMFELSSSNYREKGKAATIRALEYLNSNGRFSPSGKYAQRIAENSIRADGKFVDSMLTTLERAAHKLGDVTNKFGQTMPRLKRDELYENILNVLQNKRGFVWNNSKLFKTSEMRIAIKELYKALRDAKQAAKSLDPKLFDDFYPNLKSYLNVSYTVNRARDKFKASGKLVKEAANWYHQMAKGVMSDTQAKQIITDLIANAKTGNYSSKALEEMVNKTLRFPVIAGKSTKISTPLLQKGETMPAMIAKLLGREDDPRTIILNTLAEFSNIVHKNNFYKTLINNYVDEIAKGVGVGKPLLFRNAEEFNKFYPNIVGTPLVPVKVIRNTLMPVGEEIQQYFTTPNFAKALYDDAIFIDSLTKFEFIRLLLIPKTIVSAFKTIGSQMTVARNFITAVTFPAAAGLVGYGDDFGTAFQYMLREIVGKGKITPEDFSPLVKEFSERGITDQSAIAGELQGLLSEIAGGGLDTAARIGNKFLTNFGVKKLTDIYQGGDYIWRIYGYLAYQSLFKGIIRNADDAQRFAQQVWKRKIDVLDGAGKPKSVQELIKEISGEMVNASFPTYSRVPYITKTFRNFPLLGNFVSFQSEMLRTIPQNLLFAKRMINFTHPDNKIKDLVNYQGWRVLLGTSAVTGSATVLIDQGLKITGITPEKMNAFNESVAPSFAKSFNMPLTEQKEDRTFWTMNLNTMLPHIMYANVVNDLYGMVYGPEETFRERIMLGLFGTSVTNVFGETEQNPGIVDHMFGSFMSLPIYLEAVQEIVYNKKTSGGSVYKKEFDTLENGGYGDKIIAHIAKRILPTTVNQVDQLKMALNEELDRNGVPVNITQQFLKMGGVSIQKVDPVVSFGYKVGSFSGALRNSVAGFKSEVYNDISMTKQKSYNSYKKELRSRFRAMKKIQRDVSNFMLLGVTENEILDQQKRSQMSILPDMIDNVFYSRTLNYTDENFYKLLLRKQKTNPKLRVDDFIDFNRIDALQRKVDGLNLNDVFYTEEDEEVTDGTKQVGDIRIKGTTEEEFMEIIGDTFKPIEDNPVNNLDSLFDEISQRFPVVPPQTIAAAAPPPVNPTINPATGLSATEEALLSPTEKAIRLRSKPRTVV